MFVRFDAQVILVVAVQMLLQDIHPRGTHDDDLIGGREERYNLSLSNTVTLIKSNFCMCTVPSACPEKDDANQEDSQS